MPRAQVNLYFNSAWRGVELSQIDTYVLLLRHLLHTGPVISEFSHTREEPGVMIASLGNLLPKDKRGGQHLKKRPPTEAALTPDRQHS